MSTSANRRMKANTLPPSDPATGTIPELSKDRADRFTVSLVSMQLAVAEVQIGKHRFRLTVKEQSEGIYSSEILDLDREVQVAVNSDPRMVGNLTLRQTLEGAEEDAETDLSMYIASIGDEWPKSLQIEWNECWSG